MKCEEFEKVVTALARNQMMEAAIREEGLIHADVCGRCATRLRDEEVLLSGISAVVAEISGEGAPARVEAALLAAFHAQKQGTASSIVMTPPSRNWHSWSWKLAAVAAGILILIAVMVMFWRPASTLKAPREEQAVGPPPTSPPQAPSVAPEQVVVHQPENLPKRVRHAKSVIRSEEIELVTRFFPLREGEDLNALESVQVVRVELTSSALGELGLLVDVETPNEAVKADVLVGQDGLARAIRFVHLAQVR